MKGVTRSISYRRSCMVSVALSFGFLLVFFYERYHASEPVINVGIQRPLLFDKENGTVIARKLLALGPIGEVDGATNRIGGHPRCSMDNIDMNQGPTAPLPSGIPTYTVIISNVCVSGCTISNIHVACGWFSSARLINPKLFRRLCYNDCLVNDGQPLAPGETLTFQYANSFSYPLSFSSISCS